MNPTEYAQHVVDEATTHLAQPTAGTVAMALLCEAHDQAQHGTPDTAARALALRARAELLALDWRRTLTTMRN